MLQSVVVTFAMSFVEFDSSGARKSAQSTPSLVFQDSRHVAFLLRPAMEFTQGFDEQKVIRDRRRRPGRIGDQGSSTGRRCARCGILDERSKLASKFAAIDTQLAFASRF